MILHPDGRVEGTPEEVAVYRKLHANMNEYAQAKAVMHDFRATGNPNLDRAATISTTNVGAVCHSVSPQIKLVDQKREHEVQYTSAKMAEMKRNALQSYPIEELRTEISRRKKIAEETGMLL